MSWRMIGKPIATADLVAPIAVSQRFRHATVSFILRAIQVGVVIYNSPTYTSLEARLYSDNAGSPGVLIATSTNSWTKSEINTLASGFKNVGFSFNFIPLRAAEYYHIVLFPNGYIGDSTAHIAWRFSYPDPQYRTGINLNAAQAATHPLELSIIGSGLEGV